MAKVLIVEDERMIRSALELAFEKDYDVITAVNGSEALDRLDGVDLIITDIIMPVMDGYKLIELLKDKDIPIIVASNLDDMTVIDKVSSKNVKAIFNKSTFTLKEVKALVSKHIKQ